MKIPNNSTYRRISRKNVPIRHQDTNNWARPDLSGWTESQKKRFFRFENAIKDYLAGGKINKIEKQYALNISQVQEQLARALTHDSQGNILGFCALIPSLHLRSHERVKDLPRGLAPSASSCKGGLIHLLKRENLLDEFEARVLNPDGKRKSIKVCILSLQNWIAHELTNKGYRQDEYPFTTKRPLYSSISRLVKKLIQENLPDFTKAYGSNTQIANISVMNGKKNRAISPHFLEEVEIDEHKLHGIGFVRIIVNGIEKKIPAERAVGIAIINRGASAVLGAAVCLNPEAKAETLIEAMRSAVIPGYQVKLPSGKPAPAFRPCDFDASLSGTLWSVAYVDNAKIHTGDHYLNASARMGAQTCYGPLGSWSGRPNIENLFSQVVRGKFDRLPSATRKGLDYPTGASPAEQAIRHEMDLETMCEAFYGIIGQINTSPNEGLLNQSPIDVLRNELKGRFRPILRRLPPVTAANPEVGVQAIQVWVKQRSKDNLNLYISYGGNKYSNETLCSRADLKGEKITIHVATNLRTVLAFERNGFPLGTLTADGIWGTTDHTRDIKLSVARDKDLKFSQHGAKLNVVDSLLIKQAKRVLKSDATRPKGGVAKGALQLQRSMQITGTETVEIHTPSEKHSEYFPSMKSVAERARAARKALHSIKGGKV